MLHLNIIFRNIGIIVLGKKNDVSAARVNSPHRLGLTASVLRLILVFCAFYARSDSVGRLRGIKNAARRSGMRGSLFGGRSFAGIRQRRESERRAAPLTQKQQRRDGRAAFFPSPVCGGTQKRWNLGRIALNFSAGGGQSARI